MNNGGGWGKEAAKTTWCAWDIFIWLARSLSDLCFVRDFQSIPRLEEEDLVLPRVGQCFSVSQGSGLRKAKILVIPAEFPPFILSPRPTLGRGSYIQTSFSTTTSTTSTTRVVVCVCMRCWSYVDRNGGVQLPVQSISYLVLPNHYSYCVDDSTNSHVSTEGEKKWALHLRIRG